MASKGGRGGIVSSIADLTIAVLKFIGAFSIEEMRAEHTDEGG